jgi:hypothetical protein
MACSIGSYFNLWPNLHRASTLSVGIALTSGSGAGFFLFLFFFFCAHHQGVAIQYDGKTK